MRALLLASLLSIALLGLGASTALGANLSVGAGDDDIAYGSDAGGHALTVTLVGPDLVFTASAVIAVDPDDTDVCSGDGTPQVSCTAAPIADLDINGDSGGDTLTVDPSVPASIDLVMDGLGSGDLLSGGAGDGEINGGDGSDAISGGGGDDLIRGYEGVTDTQFTVVDGGNVISGDGGEDDVRGAGSVDTVLGGNDDDLLSGGAGNDTVNGGEGDDVLGEVPGFVSAGLGADTYVGGETGEDGGGDWISYETRTGAVVVDIDSGSDDGNTSDGPAGARDNIGPEIENLRGGGGNDLLIGDAGVNQLEGLAGSDTFLGGPAATVDGADRFVEAAGQGTDGVSYGNRADDLVADLDGAADDGAPGENDEIDADIENLTGGFGDDDLVGDGDANILDGAGGDDELSGGSDPVPDGADSFFGANHGTAGGQNGAGGDTVSYSVRTAAIVADIGGANDGEGGCPAGAGCEDDDVQGDVENLVGGGGDDLLTGDFGPNALDGGAGADTVAGGQGAGPDGADSLQGGGGLGDTISYANRTDNLTAALDSASGPDGDVLDNSAENLTGGNGNDVLVGSLLDNAISGGNGDDELRGGGPPSASGGSGPDGADVLAGDANGAAGDTVSYANRSDAINADIGDGADDTDGDDVHATVENLSGGAGGDTLTGSASPNKLIGGLGSDVLSSLAGSDRIEAVDGILDMVDCGTESDSAAIDTGLDTQTGCESIDAPPLVNPPAQPPADQPAKKKKKKKCKKGKKRNKKGKCVKRKRKK